MIRVAELNPLIEQYDKSVIIFEQTATEFNEMNKYSVNELLFKAGIVRLIQRVGGSGSLLLTFLG